MAADSNGARSCSGTFFICGVAVAFTAAAGAAGTASAAAIPAAISTAGCFVRCNDGGGDTTQSMTPFYRSVTKPTAVSTMSFSGPFRYFS